MLEVTFRRRGERNAPKKKKERMNFPLFFGWDGAGLGGWMQSHTIKIIQDDGDHVRVQARAPMEEERGKNLY